MQLPLQDFTALVRVQAAAVAAAARTLMDVSVGSVLRAVLEANASVALWVQWLIVEVLSTTRAATSSGADLDSWVADFGMSRLAAVAAHGEVTFSRSTAGLAAVIPVGTLVRTGATATDEAFVVLADPFRAGWTGSGYVLEASWTSVIVPVQAVRPGRGGNVQAGVLQLLSSAVPGVDAVTNALAAQGGLDAETDAALRERFSGYIDSRTRATTQSVTFAIQGVQQGLQFQIVERVDSAGAARDGHFTVVIDDGSGVPGGALIQAVGSAIEAVRPIGGTYSVRAPTLQTANVSLRIKGTGLSPELVRVAVGTYVAGLPIGGWLTISKIVQVAHEADGRVLGVEGVLINGVGRELATPLFWRIRPGDVLVYS